MKTVRSLIYRNTKLFFKDKGLFFTSLITPLILLVLYTTFLGNVYRDSFMLSIPEGMAIDSKIIDGCVGGQLFSSLLAVSCITVSFCSNMLMVQDKVNGAAGDIAVTPVKNFHVAFGYYIATFISTFLVCMVAMGACSIYLVNIGWFLSLQDVLLIILDIFLLVMMGTALSSIINFFLSSQGAISAVGSIVSSCYGFICGAYMPISQFGEGLQKVLSFMPFTHGTSLLRNHAMRGALAALQDEGLPETAIEGLRDGIDCNIYCFDEKLTLGVMTAIVVVTVIILIAVYVLLNVFRGGKAKKA
jgi:multidrug/hemolysin transport system permease protein